MTPFSTALVTASASAWVSVPSATAASSRSFSAAARSACRAVRISSRAGATFASSTPSFSASALARAASRSSAVEPVLGGRVGRPVLLADRPQRLGQLAPALTPSLLASSCERLRAEAVTGGRGRPVGRSAGAPLGEAAGRRRTAAGSASDRPRRCRPRRCRRRGRSPRRRLRPQSWSWLPRVLSPSNVGLVTAPTLGSRAGIALGTTCQEAGSPCDEPGPLARRAPRTTGDYPDGVSSGQRLGDVVDTGDGVAHRSTRAEALEQRPRRQDVRPVPDADQNHRGDLAGVGGVEVLGQRLEHLLHRAGLAGEVDDAAPAAVQQSVLAQRVGEVLGDPRGEQVARLVAVEPGRDAQTPDRPRPAASGRAPGGRSSPTGRGRTGRSAPRPAAPAPRRRPPATDSGRRRGCRPPSRPARRRSAPCGRPWSARRRAAPHRRTRRPCGARHARP